MQNSHDKNPIVGTNVAVLFPDGRTHATIAWAGRPSMDVQLLFPFLVAKLQTYMGAGRHGLGSSPERRPAGAPQSYSVLFPRVLHGEHVPKPLHGGFVRVDVRHMLIDGHGRQRHAHDYERGRADPPE